MFKKYISSLAIFILLSQTASATIYVNDLGDGFDEDSGDGVCEVTDGVNDCSLRAAIAHAHDVSDTSIDFDSGTFGSDQTISLGSNGYDSLLLSNLYINANTALGSVTIDGGGSTISGPLFDVQTDSVTIEGFDITGFDADNVIDTNAAADYLVITDNAIYDVGGGANGINVVTGADNANITGNIIGMDRDQNVPVDFLQNGVVVEGDNATIGGYSFGEGNVVGMTNDHLVWSKGASGTNIVGNALGYQLITYANRGAGQDGTGSGIRVDGSPTTPVIIFNSYLHLLTSSKLNF